MTDHCDIAIIGGGPVGTALALALRNSGLRINLFEAQQSATSKHDPRALALSYGSRLLLSRLGVWQTLTQISTIKSIHISQKNSFGRTLLNATDLNVPELGYVLPYPALQHALHNALSDSPVIMQQGATVTQLDPHSEGAVIHYELESQTRQLSARLVVVADGGKLLASTYPPKSHDYGQSAIIAHVTSSLPKADTAFERFTPDGPMALLPYQNGYELVWTVAHTQVETMLQWSDAHLLSQLHQHFGDRLGEFLTVGTRSTFPLRLKRAPDLSLQHTVLIGNAAQTLHPVAGQGFNMGLRDAWELSQEILRHAPETLGSENMLAAYTQSRRLDRLAGIHFTDGLVKLFSNDLPLLGPARAATLSLLDCLPGMKNFVARRMMFGVNG
jgi:2-octaprenyl-6-methoxyphenol hydroxylase